MLVNTAVRMRPPLSAPFSEERYVTVSCQFAGSDGRLRTTVAIWPKDADASQVISQLRGLADDILEAEASLQEVE